MSSRLSVEGREPHTHSTQLTHSFQRSGSSGAAVSRRLSAEVREAYAYSNPQLALVCVLPQLSVEHRECHIHSRLLERTSQTSAALAQGAQVQMLDLHLSTCASASPEYFANIF